MTTIAADVRLGLMVSDSNVSDEICVWKMRKVWRIQGSLIGLSGHVEHFAPFLKWCREGLTDAPPKLPNLHALVLSHAGLLHFAGGLPMAIQSGRYAIGTGAMAAMAAMEALEWADPKRAVQIVCRHDAGSRGPVRVYRL
jgi:hypothetical protein